ncbi:ribonuclease H-like protein [Saccharata proteae CBS 121410]|uniref:ribonuclease H n=1 Tax=Saccharata proteae CBS 121410 TaxID=1314787 RepID=A0A9P4HSA8_9PEZI|nr:ribonuclease H-like protein [Saccharata proteae CBS 121410]
MPITDTFDDFPIRSNQRAELCAAKAGLEFLAEVYDIKPEKEAEIWIIATDSEYVVKGMTEWLLTWKKNGWRTSKGTTPANLDLFLVLDAAMKTLEAKNVTIGLWHIPRENNKLADRLAKAAAIDGDEASK